MVQLEPHHQIPFVVRRCVEEVEARGMLQEGIYRVSGFADEIEALKLALDREGETTDMSETAYGNVNVIAGTLKLYLRLLPVPLITFQAYPSFMAAGRELNLPLNMGLLDLIMLFVSQAPTSRRSSGSSWRRQCAACRPPTTAACSICWST